MRTLKKSLCLVLALVFVLGICTVGAGAAFKDDEQIGAAYKDAVTVMSGLGIIDGFPEDGTFKPGDFVTREQAAKLVAYMVLGGANAEKLPGGSSSFSDVSPDRWSAKYINYCAVMGYFKGMGDGTFDPTGNIKGTQLAALLLRVLGYGVMGEYEGKGWDINAVGGALSNGIFDDTEATSFDAAATREETALYFFNTIDREVQGYDVDLNYYDGQGYTYASKIWNLAETSSTNPVIIEDNQATGEDYTIDDTGRKYNYESGKELIGHQVKIYYSTKYKTDNEGNRYFDTFLVQDLSTEITSTGTYYDDTYQALYKANKKNRNVFLSQMRYYENGIDIGAADSKLHIKDAADPTVNSDRLGDLQGRTTSDFMTPFSGGKIILDKDGIAIAYAKENYTVSQVKSVNADGVTLKACKFGVGPYELETAYEGIKKDEYVTVRKFGEVITIEPTTTKIVDITEKSIFVAFGPGFQWFNYYQIMDGSGYGAVKVPDSIAPSAINPGDTIEFYMDSTGKFFDAVKKQSGTAAGVVYVNSYFTRQATNSYGKVSAGAYAQCVNDAGQEVIYRLEGGVKGEFANKAAADAYIAGLSTGIFSVYVSNDLATLRTDAETGAALTKSFNRATYLSKSGSGTYFINSDTTIYYVNGTGSDMKVAKGTVLVNETSDYTVFASIIKNGSTYDVKTVWVYGKSAASLAGTYIYIPGSDPYGIGFEYAGPGGSLVENGGAVNYYTVYIDGTATPYAKLKVDDVSVTANFAYPGFYKYNLNSDNYYELEKETQFQKVVLSSGSIRDGKLYVDADGVTLGDIKVVNVTSSTTGGQAKTKDGNSYLTINSLDDLTSLLAEGYQFIAQYVYDTVNGSKVPVSVIYITGWDATNVPD